MHYTDVRQTSKDAYAHIRKEKGITQADTVLLCLADHVGGLVRREVAGILGWFPSDVSRSVNGLIGQGLVKENGTRRKPSKMYVPDNDVNEGYEVVVTGKGRAKVRKLAKKVTVAG